MLDGFKNRIDALQVDSEASPNYVPNGDAPLGDIIPGGVSPTLIIWRKLHLEVDSMEAVPEEGPHRNSYSGTVTGFRGVTPAGYTRLAVSNVPGARNRFQAGRLTIDGQEYFVRSSTLPTTYSFIQEGFESTRDAEIELSEAGSLSDLHTADLLVGMSYVLRDDDDLHRDEIGLHPALPYDEHSAEIVEAIRPKFRPAFVEVVDANTPELNPRPTVPFRLNEGVRGYWESFNTAKDLEDSPSFWAHTLVIAYQPEVAHDLDPHVDGTEPDYGGTPKRALLHVVTGTWHASMGYSVVFIEIFRDAFLGGSAAVGYPWPGNTASDAVLAILSLFHGTIAHEIGHAPGKQSEGNDHQELGLMRGPSGDGNILPPSMEDEFTIPSILRFRSSESWSR